MGVTSGYGTLVCLKLGPAFLRLVGEGDINSGVGDPAGSRAIREIARDIVGGATGRARALVTKSSKKELEAGEGVARGVRGSEEDEEG